MRALEPPLEPVLRKVARRLLPFLFLLYVFAYLDRVNVGFAAGSMERSLGFGAGVYGAGAGIFFLGYALFEIPSNLLLTRVGPRRWIGGMMMVWGVVSAAMLLVRTAPEFLGLRLLLGISEAGFFPGVVLYLTQWFPSRERARAIARFMTATAVAGVVGSPVSTALLRLDGKAHLAGWQWLFLLEGIPSVVLGAVVLRGLTESPAQAAWLTEAERELLLESLEDEAAGGGGSGAGRGAGEKEQVLRRPGYSAQDDRAGTLRAALTSRAVWLLALIYFCISVSLYAVSLWLPLLVARAGNGAHGMGEVKAGLLSSLPYLAAALTMTWVARHSDRTGERRWHLAGSLFCAVLGYAGCVLATSATAGVVSLCVVAIGTWGVFGPFWALPASLLEGDARAAGIALINSVGALGGFTGPMLLGQVRERTGSFRGGLLLTGAFALGGAGLALLVRKREPVKEAR